MGIDVLLSGTIDCIDEIYPTMPSMSREEKNVVINGLINNFAQIALFANEKVEDNYDINEFNEKLNLVLSALENDDYSLVADLLQYEIRPLLVFWTKKNETI